MTSRILAIYVFSVLVVKAHGRNRKASMFEPSWSSSFFLNEFGSGRNRKVHPLGSSWLNQPFPNIPAENLCSDVAIVGGGLGGTYTAWRLRNRGQSIHLFEASKRIGGRYYTRRVDGLLFELGGMRFRPAEHPRITRLIKILRLPSEDFVGDNDVLENRLYHLRNQNFYQTDNRNNNVPYFLNPSEKVGGVPNLIRKLYWNNVRNPNADLLEQETHDGIKIFQKGITSAYNQYVSGEAVNYIRDYVGFHSDFVKNTNAALQFTASNSSGPPEVLAVRNGMSAIPETLLGRFKRASRRNRYHLAHELERIENNGRTFTLYFLQHNEPMFQNYRRFCARSVILAMPKRSIERIQYRSLISERYRRILDTVVSIPAIKIFLAYNQPWWKQSPVNATDINSDLPTHFTLDFGKSRVSGKHGLMAVYADKDIEYWEALQKIGRPFEKSLQGSKFSTEVLRHINIHLGTILKMGNASIPEPISGAMQIWKADPYGAAWHRWKAGVRWPDVMKKVMRPHPRENLYVIGSAYASEDLQTWGEGALETADEVLRQYFK